MEEKAWAVCAARPLCRRRALTSALITIWRRTREALPHLEQNWRSSDCCRVKQPEQRSTCGGRAKQGETRGRGEPSLALFASRDAPSA